MSLSKGSMASSHTIIGGVHSAGGGGNGERAVLLSPSESSKPMPPTAVVTTPTPLAPVAVAAAPGPVIEVSLPPPDGEDGGNGVDDIPAPDYHSHSSGCNGDSSGCVSNDVDGAPISAINGASAVTISNDNVASATITSGGLDRTGGLERLRSARSSYSFIPPGNLSLSILSH